MHDDDTVLSDVARRRGDLVLLDKFNFWIGGAVQVDGERVDVNVADLPVAEGIMDIGPATVEAYAGHIANARTLFVNGPAGAYELDDFAFGTRENWKAIAASAAYSVIGGGDTVTAAARFIDMEKDISYVCTAGGAMVQYLSGASLPLLQAMEKAYLRGE